MSLDINLFWYYTYLISFYSNLFIYFWIGDALNSISFSPSSAKISRAQTHQNHHLSGSWLFYRYVEGGPTSGSIHTSVQNPNKAIVTINARTSEVSDISFLFYLKIVSVFIFDNWACNAAKYRVYYFLLYF